MRGGFSEEINGYNGSSGCADLGVDQLVDRKRNLCLHWVSEITSSSDSSSDSESELIDFGCC